MIKINSERLCAVLILFLLVALGVPGASTAFAQDDGPEIPVMLQAAQFPQVMFVLDDSGSMAAIMEHPDFDREDALAKNAQKRFPEFIFRVNSGSAAVDPNTHTVDVLLRTFHAGMSLVDRGLRSRGRVEFGNFFEAGATTLANIESHPFIRNLVPYDNGRWQCLNHAPRPCEWRTDGRIGIYNVEHFDRSGVRGPEVFEPRNFPRYRGNDVTDSNGNEFVYVNSAYNYNRYWPSRQNWFNYFPIFDSDGNPVFNNERIYTTSGATVRFNDREVFLSAGLYRHSYLLWIFYQATAQQLSELPGVSRIQLIKDVMERLVLDNPQVSFGLSTLNGTEFAAGAHSGFFRGPVPSTGR